jgi:hypothetical protein
MANEHSRPRRLDIAARAAVLALILLIARLAYLQHPWPVHGDEKSFVEAIGFPAQYPVHHPGYPLWVALGTALHAFGFSPYASYQTWSLLASVALPVLMYIGLGRGLRDGLAWWIALSFGVCPILWFTGTTALNYAAGCTVTWIVAVGCHRALSENRTRPLFAAALVASVGLCLRADILLSTAAMIAFVAWRLRAIGGLKAISILAGGALFMVGATALIYCRVEEPTPRLNHTIHVILDTSIFRLGLVDGLARNSVKLGINLIWQLGAAVLIFPFALISHGRGAEPDTRILLFLWWFPTAAFLLFVHMTEPGHMMPLLPVAYCLMALWLSERFRPAVATGIAVAIATVSTVQFIGYPWSPSSTGFKRRLDAKIAYISGAGLRQIDRRGEINRPGDFWQTAVHHAETPKRKDAEAPKQVGDGGR